MFNKIERLLPGYALTISRTGNEHAYNTTLYTITVNTSKSIRTKYPITYKDIDSALDAYNDALIQSVEKRVRDFRRIGIVFSCGIDSGIVAYLAKQLLVDVICDTSGIKNSNDITIFIEIAKNLDLHLEINQLPENDVEKM